MDNHNKSNTVQAIWVAIGSVISYSFILLTAMILSRYFSKGDYGTYKQVMYVYSTLLVVFTVGLPRAYSYFLPRVALNEVKDTISKITYLFFILGIIFSVFLYFGASMIAAFLKNPDLDYAIKLFSSVPFFMLPTMGVDGILATFKKSKQIAIYKGLSSFFQLVCVTVPVVFFNGTYVSAILGFTVSSLLICIIALYLKNMPVRNEDRFKSSIKYRDILRFSIPLLYASVWGIIMSSADQYFISNYFGKEVFAEFSNGWMDLPFVSMIVGATSIVLLPVFSKIINENNSADLQIKPIWQNAFEKTVKLIYPLLMFCMVFSEVIMIVLYGESYVNSGIYFRLKLLVNLFNLVAFSPLMLAIGATKYYAKVVAYGALISIILEFIYVNISNNPFGIAVISVISSIGVVLFWLQFIAKFLKISFIDLFPLKLILKIILISLPILLILYYVLIDLLVLDNLLSLAISFVIYATSFLYISKKMKIDYFSMIKVIIKK